MGATIEIEDPVDHLCTLLFTDIEGSTELWERDAASAELAIQGHHHIIESAVTAHDGRVVTFMGDGVFAVFESASAAIGAAVRIQRELAAITWPVVGHLKVRVGVNSGVCRRHHGEVYGRPVNLAARLEQAAHGGQIVVSEAVAMSSGADLPEGTALFDLGPHQFRGVDEPVRVHMVVVDGLRSQFPPLRSAHRGYDELPIELTTLIGRDDVVAQVGDLVRVQRLVTLWGPGGIGKTRTALRVAGQARRPFTDGVRFVDLTVVRDEAAVADVVMGTLRGVPAASEQPFDAAVRMLRPERLLLVLDSCEHVLGGVCRLVDSILLECPDVHVLATSQLALELPEEHLVALPPLPVPDHDEVHPAQITSLGSITLFVERARATDPTFTVHDGNAADVAALCRALDGIPLALELAAGRLDVESVASMARGGSELFERLESRRAGATRHSSVISSLEWSCGQLDDAERRLFSALGAFAGSFTRGMALALNAATGADRGETGRAFDRLVRASLVTRDLQRPDRFRLLETSKDVIRSRTTAAERAHLEACHADLMLARAEEYGPLVRTKQEAHACAALRAELPDHRRAMASLLRDGDLNAASRLLVEIFQFCHFQLIADANGWAQLLASRLSDDAPTVVDVCGAAALGAWFEGDSASAIALGERAVAIAERRGAPALWARLALMDTHVYTGHLDRAAPHYFAFTEESRASPEPFWQINGLGYEAISLLLFDRVEAAWDRVNRAVEMAKDLENPDCIHWALHCLGRFRSADDPIGACAAFEEAADAARSVDSRWNLTLDLIEWVGLRQRLGDQAGAAVGLLELLALLNTSGNRSQLSQTLRVAAHLLAAAGVHDAAVMAMLARIGLPNMPSSAADRELDDVLLASLRTDVGSQWDRLAVRASVLAEHDLIALCRSELERLLQG